MYPYLLLRLVLKPARASFISHNSDTRVLGYLCPIYSSDTYCHGGTWEQFTVVFALIVTEPASECVPVTTHAKTTVLSSQDSSMLIEAHKYAASARCKYKLYPALHWKTGPHLPAFIFYLQYSGRPCWILGYLCPINSSDTYCHGGTWRTIHCRLCINCYRTG